MPEPLSWSEEHILALISRVAAPQRLVEVLGVENVDLATAQRIFAARDAQHQRRFANRTALSQVPGVGSEVSERLINAAGKLPWIDYPVLLLPVRIETRFVKNELLVRVYPDRPFLSSHESRLTTREWEAGQTYIKSKAEGAPAWRELARRYGPLRAAWIARVVSQTPDGSMPMIKPDTEGWFTPPQYLALPDRFVVSLFRADQNKVDRVVRTVEGATLEGSYTAMGDPGQGAKALLDGDARWLTDFATAESRGMAIRVTDLTAEDLEKGFSRVVVVGLRSGGADAGAATLESLIEAHHYSSGFGFVPYGTPTNNTRQGVSGFSESTEDVEGSYEVEIVGKGTWGPPVGDVWTNAQRLGHAIGLGMTPESLRYIDHASDQEDAYVRYMQTALWPATGEYLLRHLVPEAIGSKQIDQVRQHFTRFVRGAGPLPVIRVGEQPYGVLPVACIWQWKASPADSPSESEEFSFDAKLHQALRSLHALWLGWALDPSRVPRVRTTNDPDKELLQILSMQPSAVSYQVRPFVSERFVAWLLIAMRDYVFGPDTSYGQLGYSPLQWVQRWADEWRKTRSVQAARWQQWTGVAASALESSPLLGMAGWWRARDLEAELNTPVTSQNFDASNSSTAPAATLLDDLIQRSKALVASRPEIAEQLTKAVNVLATAVAPDRNMDRLCRETLDLLHNRLDAWITSLATKRLHAMRRARATGIHLGAYGYVENLRPDAVRQSAGFVHAPSSGQAAAAAVLHNAYLTHRDAGAANPFRINLHSARVRHGLRLLDGVRHGQPLGALLGYQLERQLHERQCDQFIDDFRSAFPLVANKETPPSDGDDAMEMAARNVVDGLALARWWRDGSVTDAAHGDVNALNRIRNVRTSSALTDSHVREEVERMLGTLDAVSDILMFESVYQVVSGNFDRASAALQALSGQKIPPEVVSLMTPIGGKAANYRVCMLLRPAGDGEVNGPRGRMDPRVAAWAIDLFGDLKEIGCRYVIEDEMGRPPRINLNEASTEELQTLPGVSSELARAIEEHRGSRSQFRRVYSLVEVQGLSKDAIELLRPFVTTGVDSLSLDELGIEAVDLLALSGVPSGGGQRELEQRIQYFIRRELGLGHESRVTLDLRRVSGYTYGVEEAMALASQALKAIRSGSYLRPDSLCHHAQSVDLTFTASDVAELDGRITLTLQDLCRAIVALGGQPILDRRGAPLCQSAPGRLESLDLEAALLETWRYGLPDAIPERPSDPATNHRQERALAELIRRVKSAVDLISSSEGQPIDAQIRARLEAASILFGNRVEVLPTFSVTAGASVTQALLQPHFIGLSQNRIRLWFQQATAVRKALGPLEDMFDLADIWRQPSARAATAAMDFRVAQLPVKPSMQWLALDDQERGEAIHSDLTSFRDTVSIVIATNDSNVSGSNSIAGLLIDQGHETIPSRLVDTSIAFQYDAPGTQAPQAMLLAIPSTREQGATWGVNELAEIVRDTMDLAKVRAVDADAMGRRDKDPPDLPGVGAILPALTLPTDTTQSGWGTTAFAKSIDEWIAAVEETKAICLHGKLAYPKLTTADGTVWTISEHPDFPISRYARGISSEILRDSQEIEVRGDAGDISKRIFIKDYRVGDYPRGAMGPTMKTIGGVVQNNGVGHFRYLQLQADDRTLYYLYGGLALELEALQGGMRVTVTGYLYQAGSTPANYFWVDSYTFQVQQVASSPIVGVISFGFEGVYFRDLADKYWMLYMPSALIARMRADQGSLVWVVGTKTAATGSDNAPSNPSGQPAITNVSRYGVLRPKGAIVRC